MSLPTCYYYDLDRNRCRYYDNENLDELLSENARLRDIIADDEENAKLILAENKKLRELIDDLRDHIEIDDGFGPDTGWMLERMRESEIEVDA